MLCVVIWAAVPAACESRVVRYNPMLGGLPGSESGTPIVRDQGDYQDPTRVADEQIVLEDATGKKTLIAKTGRHLMIHIHQTLEHNDKALFVDQVLSDITRREYYTRGLDPGAAFDVVLKRREDVLNLFDAIPAGEFTPGVFMRSVGGGVQRIEVDGVLARGLRWTGMDMVMEGGNWKLRWFVTPRGSRR